MIERAISFSLEASVSQSAIQSLACFPTKCLCYDPKGEKDLRHEREDKYRKGIAERERGRVINKKKRKEKKY
jgi:hypothetical protein